METHKIEIPNDILITEIRKMLSEGRSATFRVKGYSMRPLLENERDSVKIESVMPEDIQVKDVILAEVSPRVYVLHRVIKRIDNQLTLRGDGNVRGVEHCTTENVIGKATAFYRKGRKMPDLATSRKWRVYSNIWLSLSPMRRILLGIFRRLPFKF